MNFLKNVLSTIVGLFIFCIIFFFGAMIITAAIGAAGLSSGDGIVKVENNSILELELDGIYHDYSGKYNDPWMVMVQTSAAPSFQEVLKAIDEAKNDDKIKGISIKDTYISIGLGQMKELRDKLIEFKESGKFIVAYSNAMNQENYYIASVADRIYLNPVGSVDFRGLYSEIMFFKDFQEKYGVKMEVIRHGKYKSAVEPYLENEISAENREQMTELLKSFWSTWLNDISKSRNISIENLQIIADELGARNAQLAIDNKIIDELAYEDEYNAYLKGEIDLKKDSELKDRIVSIQDYSNLKRNSPSKNTAKDKIAIVYAQGEIRDGEGSVDIISDTPIREALQKIREDDNFKAVVLRVDSPGGSALTSELIWREIELTKKVKPVVVSMGNYAASGGYYIAAGAHKIIADPTTLTGSIGVFGALPNFKGLTDNMGIHTSIVTTNKNSHPYSVFQPLESETRELITEGIEEVYSTFIQRVAEGRKMTTDQVNAIAQGRIWTGTQALELGLVDQLGNLETALAEAAKLAEIKEYRTTSFPEYDTKFGFKNLLGMMQVKTSKEAMLKEELGEESYRLIQKIRDIHAREGAQLLLPYEIRIR